MGKMGMELKAVNSIRLLSADAVEKAKSGHPGLPMGGASMAWVLWSEFLKHNPAEPTWPDRDRFVLSAGHGSMLLYSLLHLFGYGLETSDLENFRQWDSLTPGHPEFGHTVGVETTTGPLGQGFANAVGMAIAEARLAAEFGEVVNHHTWVYAGDGCLMEGISYEAASLAGHLKLGKLICLYDDNKITIDGSTDLAFTEDVGKRFEAMGWQVLRVKNGNDLDEIRAALRKAKAEGERPTLVMVRTVIGYGSPSKAGKASAHGAPLGNDELVATRKALGWDYGPFEVPQEVRDRIQEIRGELVEDYTMWQESHEAWRQNNPQLGAKWDRWFGRKTTIPELNLPYEKPLATRAVSGVVMQELARVVDNLVGGSADLNGSTNTYLEGKGNFGPENRKGNNIFFGVREHAMAAICNGLVLHGGLRAFCSTFLVFSDYLKPAIRLSALSRLPVVYVFTHDSIGVGEDGPTHQPIEHLAMLRAIPNTYVFRPADGRETEVAWRQALSRTNGPSVLVLSRQGLPQLDGSGYGAQRGGYVLVPEGDKLDIVLIATGSEVQLAVKAAEVLKKKGVHARVVSMPCKELFAQQDGEYRDMLLPPDALRLVIEAGHSQGWGIYADKTICIDEFGASAPGDVVMANKGFNVDNVVNTTLAILAGEV